ncbi:energy transducer TonB [Aureimonas sp. ME7]|uniref:energy transducer TonB n=1 Tax=Aureimonas sp. ME7 TaxID=2744252 RepID=UPI0015F3BF32|nr:energy transducer TonB [Aureimonas sp. ME7]
MPLASLWHGLLVGVVLVGSQQAMAEDKPKPPMSKAEWARAARTAINTPYPDLAGFAGIGGDPTARVEISVNRDGSVRSATLRRTSGASVLDEAALRMARTADDIPPFTPDMTSETVTLVAPFVFRFPANDPARPVRLFVDAASGLRVELPAPLSVQTPKEDDSGNLLVDISADGLKADGDLAQPARICNLTMEQRAKTVRPDQAALNEPANIEAAAARETDAMRELGYDVVATSVSDHDGARLVTIESRERDQPTDDGWITFNLFYDRPEGTVSLICMAADDEADSARRIIGRIVQGTSVMPE